MLIKYLHFYSFVALILHLLYFLNIIGNTYPIALFVLVVSQILLFIYPGYLHMYGCKYLIIDFVLHWIPYLLIKEDCTNTDYLTKSLIIYLIIFNYKIVEIYRNPIRFLNK